MEERPNVQPSSYASLVIGGDLCPLGRNEPLFREGNAEAAFGDLLHEFRNADLPVATLEGPLIRQATPVNKAGLHTAAEEACINGVKAAGIVLLNLANNHIMDHGTQGLRSTVQACVSAGVGHVGAGESLGEARGIFAREIRGQRVGILAVAEHEFGMAAPDAPGVNPLDVIDFLRNAARYRQEFDHLVVLLHGGNEYYPYPRPGLMDTCRFLVEQGASAVICQHTHCPGCMETYRGVPIVYGQGNLLFDLPIQRPMWHDGLLIRLELEKPRPPRFRLIPFVQSDSLPGARRMSEERASAFLDGFAERSRAIQDPGFVEAQWRVFCLRNERHYLNTLHGKTTLLRRIAGKLNMLHRMDSDRVRCWRLNMIHCESHREALVTLLSMDPRQRCETRNLMDSPMGR
jgi:poly-gamma-glutamate capsule biosynthesis protein CapA/YwtB (metallophosphatase superfamily)